MLAEIQMLQEQRNALVERMERDHLLVTRPFIEEVTPFSFLYEPHTVTALLLMLVTMCYVAFVRPPTDNLDEGVKLCVLCCALQLQLVGITAGQSLEELALDAPTTVELDGGEKLEEEE